jgi:hypothetical protein
MEKLHHIQQRKGEAEMAVVDWLYTLAVDMADEEAIMSIITSGDIDAVPLHMFAVGRFWPRYQNGKFRNPVYVQLQKRGGYSDIYNITGIVETLEATFREPYIGMTLSLCLCLGGNDFLPRFQGITHQKLIQNIFGKAKYRQNIFDYNCDGTVPTSSKINSAVYLEAVQAMYCPKSFDVTALTYDEVRQLTIKPVQVPRKESITFIFSDKQINVRFPTLWLPPSSCLLRLIQLQNCFFSYMFTAGIHDAKLPDFSQSCLSQGGKTYDLGVDAYCKSLDSLLPLNEQILNQKKKSRQSKRGLDSTPPKKLRKKRATFSTPKKIG